MTDFSGNARHKKGKGKRRSYESDDESPSSTLYSEDETASSTEDAPMKAHMTRREIVAFNNEQFREFYAKLRVEVIKELYEYLYDSIYYDVFKEIRQRIDDELTGKSKPGQLRGKTTDAASSKIRFHAKNDNKSALVDAINDLNTNVNNKTALGDTIDDSNTNVNNEITIKGENSEMEANTSKDQASQAVDFLGEHTAQSQSKTFTTNRCKEHIHAYSCGSNAGGSCADTARADTTRADTTRADTTRADTTRADTTHVQAKSVHMEEVHGESSAMAIWTEDELAEMADRLSIESRQRKEKRMIHHLEDRAWDSDSVVATDIVVENRNNNESSNRVRKRPTKSGVDAAGGQNGGGDGDGLGVESGSGGGEYSDDRVIGQAEVSSCVDAEYGGGDGGSGGGKGEGWGLEGGSGGGENGGGGVIGEAEGGSGGGENGGGGVVGDAEGGKSRKGVCFFCVSIPAIFSCASKKAAKQPKSDEGGRSQDGQAEEDEEAPKGRATDVSPVSKSSKTSLGSFRERETANENEIAATTMAEKAEEIREENRNQTNNARLENPSYKIQPQFPSRGSTIQDSLQKQIPKSQERGVDPSWTRNNNSLDPNRHKMTSASKRHNWRPCFFCFEYFGGRGANKKGETNTAEREDEAISHGKSSRELKHSGSHRSKHLHSKRGHRSSPSSIAKAKLRSALQEKPEFCLNPYEEA